MCVCVCVCALHMCVYNTRPINQMELRGGGGAGYKWGPCRTAGLGYPQIYMDERFCVCVCIAHGFTELYTAIRLIQRIMQYSGTSLSGFSYQD